jgi:hypothetical protein
MLFFTVASIAMVVLDLYVTHARIKQYGPVVELNPLARELARDQGIAAALIYLAFYNAGILIALNHYKAETLLHVFFGAKLGLALFQLKSMQLESTVERIIRKAQEKRKQ